MKATRHAPKSDAQGLPGEASTGRPVVREGASRSRRSGTRPSS